ncbi:hypothetical protein ACIO13_00585 [Streptomyces sp. NPDC087425]|uniref:hypothetical protein n=1 Tax=Streptomyces sp. NPDC087425 TaxID=3365787 RepID=UPI00380374EF
MRTSPVHRGQEQQIVMLPGPSAWQWPMVTWWPMALSKSRLGRWAVGPLGRWAVGPLGRWAVGPLGERERVGNGNCWQRSWGWHGRALDRRDLFAAGRASRYLAGAALNVVDLRGVL